MSVYDMVRQRKTLKARILTYMRLNNVDEVDVDTLLNYLYDCENEPSKAARMGSLRQHIKTKYPTVFGYYRSNGCGIVYLKSGN